MRHLAVATIPTQTFVEHADRALALVRAELRRPKGDRTSRASDADLNYALRRIEEMRRRALDRTLPERGARYPVLTRLVVDHWRLAGEIGRAIVALEEEYGRL
ncbi:MAG TPA: hypothetical protein VFD84_03120 [Candidatus Binatia bacterium]|jgi:hypothetical protein|nr:hypothetical protein [Candidatus Binatia bacterium]